MRFRVRQVPKALKPDARSILREEMTKARDQIGGAYRAGVVKAIHATKPYKPIDQGTLVGGIVFVPKPGTLSGSVQPTAVSEPYNVVQELGRRPGRPGPPLRPIREWVARKFGLSGKQLEAAARAIRDKIHRRGFEGRFFFRRARQDTETKSLAKRLVLAAFARFKARIGGDA